MHKTVAAPTRLAYTLSPGVAGQTLGTHNQPGMCALGLLHLPIGRTQSTRAASLSCQLSLTGYRSVSETASNTRWHRLWEYIRCFDNFSAPHPAASSAIIHFSHNAILNTKTKMYLYTHSQSGRVHILLRLHFLHPRVCARLAGLVT